MPRKKQTAIAKPPVIVMQPPTPKSYELSAEEVTLLKNSICKGATDDELKFCLTVARRYEFDPFQKQIWFVKRWDSTALQSDGKRGAHIWSPVVSIDGLAYQAASHHADYGSFSEPEYGPLMEIEWKQRDGKPGKPFKAPEWARVEAWKKGATQPTVARVYWEEIYPDVDSAPLVRRMPRLMLAKCARAQVIRIAYPKKTGGLLIAEETYGREFRQFDNEGKPYAIGPTPEEIEAVEKECLELAMLMRTNGSEKPLRQLADELKSYNYAQREAIITSLGENKAQVPAETEKEPEAPQVAPSVLFSKYFPESETYKLTGPRELLLKHKNELWLSKYWNRTAKAFVISNEAIADFTTELHTRGFTLSEDKG